MTLNERLTKSICRSKAAIPVSTNYGSAIRKNGC